MAIHLVGTIGYPILTVSLPDLFSPLRRIFSFLWYRTAPTRQVIGIHALCQLQRFLKRTIEIGLDNLALHAPPEKVGPKEFAEWRRILGEASRASQFASERTKRIIEELIYRLRQITIRPTTAIRIKKMCPIVIFHDKPKGIAIEIA